MQGFVGALYIASLTESSSYNGRDPSGEWMVLDTICLLCDEVRDATYRINALLQVDENEMRDRDKQGVEDGYISWYLESQSKLHFLRPQKFYWARMRMSVNSHRVHSIFITAEVIR